jgi:excinuclease UvrABC ATPase subunit
VSDSVKNDNSPFDETPVTKYDALAILYLQKQDLNGVSPEEVVGRYIEAYDRIKKEFARQKEARRRRLNPLPL